MADREMTNQEAIEILSGIRACYNLFDEYDEIKYAALSKAIFALKAEPKKGRWEEVDVTWLADVEDQPDAIASMFCPECRRFANHVYHYGDPRYGMNFCPWCGARMGGDAK